MKKSIKSIIQESPDLHFITINKPSRDRSTWTFEVNDDTSVLNGVSDSLCNYKYRIVTLQRDTHFFISYKILFDDGSFEYFVDPKKSIHRSSTRKYIDNLLNYIIWSNDISYQKNDPSFKYTQMQMLKDNVSNYVDLCVKFGDFSSIGTGLTRDVRNLIVLDIDVNCEREDNKQELERLIILFSKYNFTPNFMVVNHESKHVQLQWLIKDCEYKRILWHNIQERIYFFENSKDVHKEINLHDFNFMELSQEGTKYRKFTRGLTSLSDKYKFGDKNYTFWKAKNFYTAFLGKYNLELKMPYVIDNKIYYYSHDDMSNFFKSKESRQEYYDNSPTMDDIYDRTFEFMKVQMDMISETSIKKIKDAVDDLYDETFELYDFKTDNNYDLSRNTFVFNTTRNTTWDVMRELNYNSKIDVQKLSQRNYKAFKSKIKKLVKLKYESENDKYGGEWPGTTNHTKYTQSEFNSTFDSSFDFAIEHYSNNTYDDEDRNKSLDERLLKKKLRHVLILYLKSKYNKIKNKDLLPLINDILSKSEHGEISNTTLKRDIKDIKKYSSDDKKDLYNYILNNINERKQKYIDTCEITTDKKEINICKKRLNRLSLCNMDSIVGFINNEGK